MNLIKKLVMIFFGFVLFSYGVAVGKYELFPFFWIQSVHDTLITSEEKDPNQSREDQIRLFKKFSSPTDIVFVGDSITSNARWNEFFPKQRVFNRGITGDTTKDILERIDTILSLKPKKAFVMAGINDVLANESVQDTLRNYEMIINQLKKSNAEVFIQSTIQCCR